MNRNESINYIIVYPLPSKLALQCGTVACIFTSLMGVIYEFSIYTILFRSIVTFLLFIGLGWGIGLFIEDIKSKSSFFQGSDGNPLNEGQSNLLGLINNADFDDPRSRSKEDNIKAITEDIRTITGAPQRPNRYEPLPEPALVEHMPVTDTMVPSPFPAAPTERMHDLKSPAITVKKLKM